MTRFMHSAGRAGKRRLLLAAGCGLAIACIALPDVRACGPWLSEEILVSRQVILRTPVGDFAQEVLALSPQDGAPVLPAGLARLAPQGHSDDDGQSKEAVPAPFQKETAELRDALEHRGVSAEQRDKILAAYREFRADLEKKRVALGPDPVQTPADNAPDPELRFDARAQLIRQLAAQPVPSPAGLPPVLSEGLPGEWADYLQGAVCFWDKDLDGARAAWERLLARPQAERLYCSTWAAYMLARISDEPNTPPEEDTRRYQRVLDLRAAGCRDVFNLASASVGWEARRALDRADCATAGRLYYLQGISSGDSLDAIGVSLRAVVAAALPDGKRDPAAFAGAVRDPFLRRVITLYIACHRFFGEEESAADMNIAFGADAMADAEAKKSAAGQTEESWLAALTQNGVKAVQEAGPIAWAAYQVGHYEEAAAWLAKAPVDDGLALWLRAKLALRDGKNAAAAGFFAQAVHAYPAEIKQVSNSLDSESLLANDGRAFRTSQFHADLGIISLSRGDYAQALTALLRSGFWRDAAYVAERVMTLNELLAYVRTNFPQAPAAAEPVPKPESTPERDEAPAPPPTPLEIIQDRITVDHSVNPAAYATRYLLARRLARAGRYAEAREFYPAPLLPKFDEYAAARNLGESAAGESAVRRADALWRAAKIERWLGMELFGSEDEPDWFVENGVYDEDEHFREDRDGLPTPVDVYAGVAESTEPTPAPLRPYVPPVSEEEKHRVAMAPVQPEKRFHYRYIAADLAWKAAALLPDKQEQTALVLAAGGRWLESVQQDKEADKFYQAIVHRCGQTIIGREAKEKGAIPAIPDQDF